MYLRKLNEIVLMQLVHNRHIRIDLLLAMLSEEVATASYPPVGLRNPRYF